MARTSKQLQVSVVIPCLNEEKTLASVIRKSFAAFKKHGINGEVVVSDNGSTDASVSIAKKEGARVVHQPLRGYGNAYLKGFAEAQGKYLVMADADDTYDIHLLNDFVAPLREGYEFVIGDRFQGTIDPGAMPWHHYWIGNPALSFAQRVLFHNNIRDSHCGMRAFSKEAYERLELHTTGMEFASEMVIRASQEKLKIKQIPTNLHARPRGSHSKLNSWRDGWRHLRFMLLYSPLYLFLIPGAALVLLGGFILGLLARGPATVFGMTFIMHPMVLGAMLVILGYQTIMFGLLTKVYRLTSFGRKAERDAFDHLTSYLSVDRGILTGGFIVLIGIALCAWVFSTWMNSNFGNLEHISTVIIAMTLIVVGAQTMFSAFFLGILSVQHR